jgi:hypothetical protein
MSNIIKISDTKNGVLAFDLIDLLNLMPPVAREINWSILDLSQFLEKQDNLHVYGREFLRINVEAHSTPGGYKLSWQDLVTYAEAINQVADGVFIGCKNVEMASRVSFDSADEDIYSVSEFVLEAFDSSYWVIFSREDDFLNRCRTTFQDVEDL